MNPQQLQQFNDMIAKVNEVHSWMMERKQQQLFFPLDNKSVAVLNEAFRTKYFDLIKVTDLVFRQGRSVDPTVGGQLVYHENSGSPVLKFKQGSTGTVKTITTS
jgi:hypothetical protein